MGLLLFFLTLSILFSFLCSILEAVLLSVSPSYISIKEQEGNPIAGDLKSFKNDIDRPLAAILTLNTVAHTVGSIGVGSQASKLYGGQTDQLISGEFIVATLMTLAILVLSEIIPKTLGANYWEALTPFTVKALKVMLFLLAPLVWMSQLLTKKMKKEKDKSVFSRVDFVAMTKVSTQSGAIKEEEADIIHNLLKFNSIAVEDIMTPRTVVVAAPDSMTIAEFHEKNPTLNFSRIPLYHGTEDNISGYFLKDELLLNLVENKGNEPLSSIIRKHSSTTNTKPIGELFKELMNANEHFALVFDKFGTMTGIVSIEDIIETLLGTEIVDEMDQVADMQAFAREKMKSKKKK